MKTKIKKQQKLIKSEYKKLKRINTRGKYWLSAGVFATVLVSWLAVAFFARQYSDLRNEYVQKTVEMGSRFDSLALVHENMVNFIKDEFEKQQITTQNKIAGSLEDSKTKAMKEARAEAGKIVNKFLLENEQAYLKTEDNDQ